MNAATLTLVLGSVCYMNFSASGRVALNLLAISGKTASGQVIRHAESPAGELSKMGGQETTM